MSVIRRIESSEWRTYREIRLHALKDSPDAFGSTYAGSIEYSDEAWQARLEDATAEQDYPVFALVEERIVGLAWARIEPAARDVVHLYQMWVDPLARGKGVGRSLVDAALDWARARRTSKMVLEVTCGDRPARRLYDAVGFRPVGEPKPLRADSDLLEQTMELQLTEGDTRVQTRD